MKNRIYTYLCAFFMFSSCSVFALDVFAGENVIWEDGPNVYFKYADQDDSAFGKNDHPVEAQEKEITAVLASLRIRDDDQLDSKQESKTVFTDQQTNLLGRYLAKGLKDARSDQDIIFAMEKSVRNLLGFNSDQFFVAGRAFYKDGKLNIIIGDYDRPRNKSYEAAYDPTHVGIVRYHFDHGRRAKSSKGFIESLVKVAGVENKQLNETRRDDWLVIDVNAALDAYTHKEKMKKEEAMEQKREEIRQILESEEIARPTRPALPTTTTSSLEERLTTLKRLRDKDLITEEEYTQKRKQLLDEL